MPQTPKNNKATSCKQCEQNMSTQFYKRPDIRRTNMKGNRKRRWKTSTRRISSPVAKIGENGVTT